MGNSKSTVIRCLVSLALLTFLSACAEKTEPSGVLGVFNSTSSAAKTREQDEKSKFMAYEHSLSIELEKKLISSVHIDIIRKCEADTKYSCVVVSSNLSSGDYQSSNISVRVKPDGVAYFSSLASEKGEVASQSTQAQDLSDSIRDNAKRTEMASNYRDKLLLLEATEGNDIEAMVKIASELSKVQSQLEFAQGERAKLFKKIETELLNINISPPSLTGFWAPIGDSLTSFGDDLAYGISDVISSAASIIPWFIFLIILFLVARFIFRLLKVKK